jgi:hypothetical protein
MEKEISGQYQQHTRSILVRSMVATLWPVHAQRRTTANCHLLDDITVTDKSWHTATM